jgi:hypothetical protein
MDGRPELDRFLRTDPRDVGCARAMEMLHVYAELAAAGGPVEEQYPGIAAHLRACGPCGEDFEGLLAALRDQAPEAPNRHPPAGVLLVRGVRQPPRYDPCACGRKIRAAADANQEKRNSYDDGQSRSPGGTSCTDVRRAFHRNRPR